MKKRILIYFLLLCINTTAQKVKPLKIGDKVPADIWSNLPKGLNTKLTILDFWATSCEPCIAAFPKMVRLQKEFDGELQIIMINTSESNEKIKERFDKLNKNRVKEKWLGLPPSIPSINEKKYVELFPYIGIPHHVWLNEDGKVIAITGGENANSTYIKMAIEKQRINLGLKDDSESRALRNQGYLGVTRADMFPAYYSAFIPFYYGNEQSTGMVVNPEKGIWRKAFINMGPIEHFRAAFRWDNFRERIVYELKDRERFIRPHDESSDSYAKWDSLYRYTYEVQLPIRNKDKWQEKYQIDAAYFLGYLFGIEAIREKRSYNAFVLTKAKEGRLKVVAYNKNLEGMIEDSDSLYNYLGPFEYFLSELYRLENLEQRKVFVDETGIDTKIWVDLKITGDLRKMSVENLRKQLQRYGLDIVEAEREVEVVVIRDKAGWKAPEKLTATKTN